jgi:hypothetical protein
MGWRRGGGRGTATQNQNPKQTKSRRESVVEGKASGPVGGLNFSHRQPQSAQVALVETRPRPSLRPSNYHATSCRVVAAAPGGESGSHCRRAPTGALSSLTCPAPDRDARDARRNQIKFAPEPSPVDGGDGWDAMDVMGQAGQQCFRIHPAAPVSFEECRPVLKVLAAEPTGVQECGLATLTFSPFGLRRRSSKPPGTVVGWRA